MIRKKQVQGLEEFFQVNNENRKIEKLNKLAFSDNINDVIKMLFSYASYIIDNGENNILFMSTLNYINYLVEESENINRKRVRKGLKKLYEKLDRLEKKLKSSEADVPILINNLENYQQKIDKIYENVKKKESKDYKIMKFLIMESRNIPYLEQTFKCFPNFVNVEDKNGNSIFLTVLDKYLDCIENSEIDDSLISYYHQVLFLMKNQDNFKLDNYDRNFCFQKIDSSFINMKKYGRQYNQRKELLNELKEELTKEPTEVDFDISKLTSKYNISSLFEDELLQEINMYKTPISVNNYPDRFVVDEYIISIDHDNTYEIDDAISIKKMKNGNYLLGVHIVNASGYLKDDSLLMKEAISRVSSIYLPKKVITMFPEDFSVKVASLNEDQYRLANSYYFEINKNGEIEKEKFVKSIIQNNKNCSFEEINDVIKNGSNNKNLEKTVNLLVELTSKLDTYSDQPEEIYINADNDKLEFIASRKENSSSGKIVEQIMRLTNNRIANFFAANNYPCLYRVHNVDDDSLEQLQQEITRISTRENKDKFDKLYKAILNTYPKAYYDTVGRHDGLNLSHYCHATSTLRRCADLLVEKGLDLCYFNNIDDKKLQQYENMIKQSKEIINAKEEDIRYFIDDYSKQYKVYKHKLRSKR